MVLEAMPLPAWLTGDVPHSDVVLSSRVRYARNLRGFAFPHRADPEALREILAGVGAAASRSRLGLSNVRTMSDAERDYLLGSRLISREFRYREVGREVWLDRQRCLSVMVNEEDHLRFQALTPGWSPGTAASTAEQAVARLGKHLVFARMEGVGYLTASPQNAGSARRVSALFHLIGLAHTGRLAAVLQALAARGLAVRGMFGEASRATGAFFQISSTHMADAAFSGAGDYLTFEERQARSRVATSDLAQRARSAAEFAVGSAELNLTDALRVFAWMRWASAAGVDGFGFSHRLVDRWVATMEVRSAADPTRAARDRAAFVRGLVEGAWKGSG